MCHKNQRPVAYEVAEAFPTAMQRYDSIQVSSCLLSAVMHVAVTNHEVHLRHAKLQNGAFECQGSIHRWQLQLQVGCCLSCLVE